MRLSLARRPSRPPLPFSSPSPSRRRGARSIPRGPTAPSPASSTSTPIARMGPARRTKSRRPPPRVGLKFIVFTDHGDATRRTRSAGVPLRRAVSRRRRNQHDGRTLRRARTCRRRRIRSAGKRGTSSRTSGASAASASPRTRTRPSRSCAGGNGRRRSTRWSSSTPTPAGASACSGPAGGPRPGSLASLLGYPFRPAETIALASRPSDREPGPLGRADARAEGRRPRGSRRACQPPSAQHRPGRDSVGAGHSQLRGVVPGAVDPRAPRPVAERRCRGRRRDDSSRASRRPRVHGDRRGSRRRRRSSSARAMRGGTVQAGDELRAGGPVTLRVRSNAPAGFSTTVWRGTRRRRRESARASHSSFRRRPNRRRTGSRFVPPGRMAQLSWIVSNPIYVRGSEASETCRSDPGRP